MRNLVLALLLLSFGLRARGQSDGGGRRADEIVVSSAAELRDVLQDDVADVDIRLPSELTLSEALRVEGDGVSLLGAADGGTLVRCGASSQGAALVVSAKDVLVQSINFKECPGGSVIRVDAGTRTDVAVDFEGVSFHDNGSRRSGIRGGAVASAACQSCRPAQLTFTSCSFANNRARLGGAVFAEDTYVTFRSCRFTGNEADLSGGAVYSNSRWREAEIRLEDSVFEGNVAYADPEVHGLTDMELRSTSDMSLAYAGVGGGVYAFSSRNVTITRTQFLGNAGCRGGGGLAFIAALVSSEASIQAYDAEPSFFLAVTDSAFENNAAICGPGREMARFTYGTRYAFAGGGILRESLYGAVTQWTIQGSSFVNNSAVDGGAMFDGSLREEIRLPPTSLHRVLSCWFDSNVALSSGGTFYLQATSLEAVNITVRNSRAAYGGGITTLYTHLRILPDEENPELMSVIEGCTAVFAGGMLFESTGEIHLTRVRIRNNVAAVLYGGFGAFRTESAVHMSGVIVENNTALYGAGIAAVASRSLTITSYQQYPSIVRNNVALAGGGLLVEGGFTSVIGLSVTNTSFTGNRAVSADSAEVQRTVHLAQTYGPAAPAAGQTEDPEQLLQELARLRSFAEVDDGSGGAVAIDLQRVHQFTTVEAVFENVYLADNEAVVGGGMAVYQAPSYWNRGHSSTDSCFPRLVRIDPCQQFLVRNITITSNRAQHAGGLFATNTDGIRFHCAPGGESVAVAELGTLKSRNDRERFCAHVHGNFLTVETSVAADFGSRATHLAVEGLHGPLRTVASGEHLPAPCNEAVGRNCSGYLRIAVRDALDQTIRYGISDASLDLTLVSGDIFGALRYTAVNGVAVIDNTAAMGVGISSSVTVISDDNPEINVTVNFSTRDCYPGELFQEDICSACPRGQYGFNPHHTRCQSCPDNAECSGGASLVPMAGFWHSNPFSPVISRCLLREACDFEGREQRLAEFYRGGSRLAEHLRDFDAYLNGTTDDRPDFEGHHQCSRGHEGVLCGSCRAGYGHSYTGSCDECRSSRSVSRLFVFLSGNILFLVIGVNCAITLLSTGSRVRLVERELRREQRGRPRRRRTGLSAAIRARRSAILTGIPNSSLPFNAQTADSEDADFRHLFTTMQQAETFKILMNYLQVTAAAVQLQASWGSLLEAFFDAEAIVAGLSADVIAVPTECAFGESGETAASVRAQWLRLFTPFLVQSAIQLTFTVGWVFRLHKARANSDERSLRNFTWENYATGLIAIAVVATYFSYIDVFRYILVSIDCVEIEDAQGQAASRNPYVPYATERNSDKVWAGDTSVRCFQGSHLLVGVAGAAGVLLSFCGVLSILFWLPLNRRRVADRTFTARYWFLYQAYRKTWYTNAWEAVILTRKALIVSVVVFSSRAGPVLQASLCVAVLTLAHALQTIFEPFKTMEGQEYVPRYAAHFLERCGMQRLGSKWVELNNRANLNVLESLSLLCSATVFLTAIVKHNADSTATGRTLMESATFALNVAFVLYLLYRLYAGGHLLLDHTLNLDDPALPRTPSSTMGIYSLARKTLRFVQSKIGVDGASSADEDDLESEESAVEELQMAEAPLQDSGSF